MFPIPIFRRAFAALGTLACAACAGVAAKPDASQAPQAFYTVTGEIALSRHEPRVAALQYAAAAETDTDEHLLAHAAEITAQCLQPSLTAAVATRWIDVDPTSVAAHRAAAKAALELFQIDKAAAHYRVLLGSSSLGTEAEFTALDTELAATDNVFGARQLADRLVAYFPASAAALRMQGYAALRADDPAAAARSLNAALAAEKTGVAGDTNSASAGETHRALLQSLWRARILAGDGAEPLAQSRALLDGDATAAHRLDYALLLLAAQQTVAGRTQLEILTHDPTAAPVALRLLGMIDFQEGELDDASVRFAQLVTTGKLLDDAIYYLGVIAERHGDPERALKFYAQVQDGENALPALLRAATLLRAHGAAPIAEELLNRLVEEDPQRAPETLAARARIYADTGDLAQANAVLDLGTLQYPDSVELRYARATLADEHGNTAVSVRELHAVLRLRPDDPAALNAYGYTLADHHRQLRTARRLIERAYAAAPKNTAILDSLGWVLYRQGHGEQALPYLNAAYLDDRGGDIAAHLGEVLWQLGRRAEAEHIWIEAGRAEADNPLLKATRLRLHAS